MSGPGADIVPFEPPQGPQMEYREPPHNIEAEQALLGAVLVNNAVLDLLAGTTLRPEHFFEPVHGRMYDDMVELVAKGRTVSFTTLKRLYALDDALADVGGASYIARLAGSAVTLNGAPDYARAIIEAAGHRAIIEACHEATELSYEPKASEDLETVTAVLSRAVDEVLEIGRRDGGFIQWGEVLEAAVTDVELGLKGEARGVRTGIAELDTLIGGLESGTVSILAGRPSMGKTAMALAFARNAAMPAADGTPALTVPFFSVEMNAPQMGVRDLATMTQISIDRLRRGDIQQADFERVLEARQMHADLPLYLDPTRGLTVRQIRDRARYLRRIKGPLGLVVVDYLQLLRAEQTYRGNRVAEVTEISQDLSYAAGELDVPFLVLSQLSRAVEQREEKRPVLSDLRDSGAIEQDARLVMFVYRDHYYHRRPPDKHKDPGGYEQWMAETNVVEVIVAKQNQGALGTARVWADLATNTVKDRRDPMPRAIGELALEAGADPARDAFELTEGAS